jgi:hypothetical protein
VIRELVRDDVSGVIRLELELNPHQVWTERGLVHELEFPLARERRRDWVALEGETWLVTSKPPSSGPCPHRGRAGCG